MAVRVLDGNSICRYRSTIRPVNGSVGRCHPLISIHYKYKKAIACSEKLL